MIYQFLTTENFYTTELFVRNWAPQLRRQVHLIPIQHLHEADKFPVGTFIFSDLERLTDERRALLGQIYAQLEAHGPPMKLLNHPLRSMGKHGLLKTLHQEGINGFRTFKPTELPSDLRFPVFMRVERDHKGARTPLLNSWSELEQGMIAVIAQGFALADMIITEFCDTSDDQGIFRRYIAYRIGDHTIPRGLTFSNEWQIKGRDDKPGHRIEEKDEYVFDNPHRNELLEVFELAGIDYGRADYGIKDGKIQVWEINTAPLFGSSKPEEYPEEHQRSLRHSADALADAFEEIGQPPSEQRVSIKLSWKTQPTYS